VTNKLAISLNGNMHARLTGNRLKFEFA